MFENEYLEEQEQSSLGIKIGLYILFSPIVVVGLFLYFIFFRLLKWKPHLSCLLIGLFGIIFGLYTYYSDLTIWTKILWYVVLLGFVFGIGYIIRTARLIKTQPQMKFLYRWVSKFKYRKTPFEIIKRELMKDACKKGKANSYDLAPMGVLESPVILNDEEVYNKDHIVSRYYSEAYKTTLVSGATGSGKSVTMLNLMRNDILAGYTLCVLDFKKAPDIAYFLSKWAKENNREFYHFVNGEVGNYQNPFCEEQATYDPLSSGNATSKADMLLNLRKWDTAAEHYKQQTQRILGAVFFLLERVDKSLLPKIKWDNGGLAQLTSALYIPNLHDMIEVFSKSLRQKGNPSNTEIQQLEELRQFYQDVTSNRNRGLKEQIDVIRGTCSILMMSSYSDWLVKGSSNKHIDLFKISTSNEAPIVLFQFSPNEEPEFAKHMGSIIMSDLARVSAYKNAQGNDKPFGLYVDEFQTLNPLMMTGIVEKARSAKFFSTFGSQSLDQIIKEESNGEAILKSLLDTASNFIVHNGSSQDSAERFSKIVGTTKQLKMNVAYRQNTGLFSFFSNIKNKKRTNNITREEEVYKLPPDELMNLSSPQTSNNFKGTAYYITKECSESGLTGKSQVIARKFHNIVHESLLEPVPEYFKRNLLSPKTKKIKEIENIDYLDETIYKDPEEVEPLEEHSENFIDNIEEHTQKIMKKSSFLPDLDFFEETENDIINEISAKSNDDLLKDFNKSSISKKITSFDRMTKKK